MLEWGRRGKCPPIAQPLTERTEHCRSVGMQAIIVNEKLAGSYGAVIFNIAGMQKSKSYCLWGLTLLSFITPIITVGAIAISRFEDQYDLRLSMK